MHRTPNTYQGLRSRTSNAISLLGVIGAQEGAFDMFVSVQVAVEGKGWMVLAIDNYDYGIF